MEEGWKKEEAKGPEGAQGPRRNEPTLPSPGSEARGCKVVLGAWTGGGGGGHPRPPSWGQKVGPTSPTTAQRPSAPGAGWGDQPGPLPPASSTQGGWLAPFLTLSYGLAPVSTVRLWPSEIASCTAELSPQELCSQQGCPGQQWDNGGISPGHSDHLPPGTGPNAFLVTLRRK